MPGEQQQSQTGDTGTTPTQQPQTDWRSIADAAANIPNNLYVSRAGSINSWIAYACLLPKAIAKKKKMAAAAGGHCQKKRWLLLPEVIAKESCLPAAVKGYRK
uniref:Uncharacterized protein n=1 Tax=Branchiostoma floridae TaxID=7739 RepID=C3XXS9_BRAFL|eukprot:XP_002611529.1 hypothetical protein BRAFLDRAFT_63834 [Branchiostoma floridae]